MIKESIKGARIKFLAMIVAVLLMYSGTVAYAANLSSTKETNYALAGRAGTTYYYAKAKLKAVLAGGFGSTQFDMDYRDSPSANGRELDFQYCDTCCRALSTFFSYGIVYQQLSVNVIETILCPSNGVSRVVCSGCVWDSMGARALTRSVKAEVIK